MHCRVQSFHLDVSQALSAYSTRTHPPAPFDLARAIHRLDSANSVVSCAPERMLDLRPDAGLDALDFIDQRVNGFALVQCTAFAGTHGHMPGHARRGIGALVRALVARVAQGIGLVTVQQRVGFDDIADVGRGASDRVHQARLGIGTDVRFMPKHHCLPFLV